MQQDHQHIDKKLRELESQSLPDLTRIDEHWQQLSNSLQPIGTHARAPRNYTWWIVAAVVTSSIIFIATYIASNKTEKENIVGILPEDGNDQIVYDTIPTNAKVDSAIPATRKTKTEPRKSVTPASPKKSTAPADTVSASLQKNPVKRKTITTNVKSDTIILKKKNPTKTQRVLIEVRTTDGKDTMLEAISTKEITDTVSISNADKLEGFFKQMEKEAEEFLIDNYKDTVIIGRDGSALLIPANAFYGRKDVTITMKEYYSYADIITNRLLTSSNGEQLISGGMIYLKASISGKEIDLATGKSIRWFIPDTSASMNDMQIFRLQKSSNETLGRQTLSLDSTQPASQVITNWIPSTQQFNRNFLVTKVKVFDIRDEPYKTVYGNKTKAVFLRNKSSAFTNKQLQQLLKEKYSSYYDKIAVRKAGKEKEGYTWSIFVNYGSKREYYVTIGDTAWISLLDSRIYKLPALDTMIYWNNSNSARQSAALNENLKKLVNKFSVNISSLGWINCDRFYRDKRPLVEYVVNLNDSAQNYFTILVFDKMKSFLGGYVSGNKVIFKGVPEGQSARIISVGVKNGKTIGAMSNIRINRTSFNQLKFQEITPEKYKEQAATMDN